MTASFPFVYDGANIIEEVTPTDTKKYYRGIEIVKNDDNLYYIYNGQGDVAILTNADGIVANYTFDAYGNTNSTNEAYNPFGYRGEYTDSESGLIYLRNRYYDADTGRFVSEDPVKDGLNWYVYCGSNPILFVDSCGLFRIIDGTSYDRYQLGSGNINNKVDDYISEDIKKMQIRLQELGYLDKSITSYGYFGKQTLTAVNSFKKDNFIQNNTRETEGIVGATTWAMMELDFDVIETVGFTESNISIGKGVLRVDRNITNANMVNILYAADAIKNAYKIAYGENFNVSTSSVYWELVGHIFADEVAERNRGGILEPFWARVQRSTNVIDIGDDIIAKDGNRKVWDYLAGERRFPW